MARWRRRLGIAVVVGVLGLLASSPLWLRPDAAPSEFETQAPTETTLDPTKIAEGPVTVRIVTEHGEPAGETALIVDHPDWDSRTWMDTDEDGILRLDAPLGTILRPLARSTPERATVTTRPEELVFRLQDRCPFEVRVADPQQDPIAVPLEAWNEDEAMSSATGEDGVALLDLPCGAVRIEAHHPDWPTASAVFDTNWEEEGQLTFRAGRRIHGHVIEPDGTPVPKVRVESRGQSRDRSEVDGGYELWVQRAGPHVIEAETGQHRPELDVVLVSPDAVEVEHDIVVEPAHRIVVRCAGLEDDSCAWVPLIQCTEPHLPVGTLCTESGGEVRCRCPEGEAAVRAGTRSVLVGPDDDIAWLDYRADGGLRGRVLVDGEPGHCKLSASQTLGALSMRLETCDADGIFEIASLDEGSWSLDIQSSGVQRTVGPIEVLGDTDLGDIDLLEGTLVHGEILDAQTGEPVAGVTVAAVALEGSRPTSAGRGLSDEDGLYAIRGLPPGEIQVFLPTDPLDRASGVLDEELALDLVRSPPGDVSTRRGANGSLWVTGLGDDAPDGLEAGDRIEAVELFGVDPNELIPGAGDALLDVLAGASDLPGVTLVVERDGEFWELD